MELRLNGMSRAVGAGDDALWPDDEADAGDWLATDPEAPVLSCSWVGDALVVAPAGSYDPAVERLARNLSRLRNYSVVLIDLPGDYPPESWRPVLDVLRRQRRGLWLVPARPARTSVVLDRARGAVRLTRGTTTTSTIELGQWLADQTGHPVIAYDGPAILAPRGRMFVPPEAGAGWLVLRPGALPQPGSRRYPAPAWASAALDESVTLSVGSMAEPLPAGAWIHPPGAGGRLADLRHWLCGQLGGLDDQVTVVIGHGAAPPVPLADVAQFWSRLDARIRPAIRFTFFGPMPGLANGAPPAQILADLLGEEVAVNTGLPITGWRSADRAHVRTLNGDGSFGWHPFALELGYRPRAYGNDHLPPPAVLRHRAPIKGLPETSSGVYLWAPEIELEVIPAGLWLRHPGRQRGADEVRCRPLDPRHPVLVVGTGRDGSSQLDRSALEVLHALDPELRALCQVESAYHGAGPGRMTAALSAGTVVSTSPVLTPSDLDAAVAAELEAALPDLAAGHPAVRLWPLEDPPPFSVNGLNGYSHAGPGTEPEPAGVLEPADEQDDTGESQPAADGDAADHESAAGPEDAAGESESESADEPDFEEELDAAEGLDVAEEPDVAQAPAATEAPEPAPPVLPPLIRLESGPHAPAANLDSLAGTAPDRGPLDGEPGDADAARGRTVSAAGGPDPGAGPAPAPETAGDGEPAPARRPPADEPAAAFAPAAPPAPEAPLTPGDQPAGPVAPPPPAADPGPATAGPAVPAAPPDRNVPPPAETAAASRVKVQPTPKAEACVIPPPRDLDRERAWVRQAMSSHFDSAASVVMRMLSETPGLRGNARNPSPELLTELVAARLYLTGQSQQIDNAVRAASVGPHVPFGRCVAAGLHRLPSYRGPARLRASLTDEEWQWYGGQDVVTEWAFCPALAVGHVRLPGTVDFLIWSMTARRANLLESSVQSQVLFLPGTRFKVLQVRDGEQREVLLREVAPAEAGDNGPDGSRPLDELARNGLDKAAALWRANPSADELPERYRNRFASPPGILATGPAPANGPAARPAPGREGK